MSNQPEILKYAVTGPWGELKPARQSMALADIILAAGFEPLTIDTGNGFYTAGIAKEWRVSEDRRQVTFLLNLDKRFSDGTQISSFLYKEAMLDSLRQAPIYKNQATRDVFYALVGFEDFLHSNDIVGINTPSADTLVLSFKRPYRDILMEISGIRYSIYKKNDKGQHLGTGPYIMEEISDRQIHLRKNPYYFPQPSIENIVIDNLDREQFQIALCEAKYDYYLIPPYQSRDTLCQKNSSIFSYEEIPSKLDTHLFLGINDKSNNILSNHRFRLLFEKLFYSEFDKLNDLKNYKTIPEIQFFLPTQPGRLEMEELTNYRSITETEKVELIKAIKQKPLFILTGLGQENRFHKLISAYLQELGIDIHPNSRTISFTEFQHLDQLQEDWDIYYASTSIGCDDPDGLYHLFGKHGALTMLPFERPLLQNTLEHARSLLEFSQLHEAYKEVNRTIFSEIPAIHLGYSSFSVYYNENTIEFRGRGSSMFFLQNYSWK